MKGIRIVRILFLLGSFSFIFINIGFKTMFIHTISSAGLLAISLITLLVIGVSKTPSKKDQDS